MADIKWIKIATSMFDDEKIDFIESLPEGDSIIVIWAKLLTLAGKCNSNGFIMLTENIPYDEKMLSHKFKRNPNTVSLALETFKRLKMLSVTEDGFYITNWEKHQNIEGMEKIKEQDRLRKQKQRLKEKTLSLEENCDNENMSRDNIDIESENVTDIVTSCHVTVTENVTPCHAIDLDLELDKESNKTYIVQASVENLEIQKIPDELSPKEPSKKEIESFFESIWSLYPNKLGKAKISDKTKKNLYKLGFDSISNCIKRYEHSKADWKQWQNGSTFFNSGYLDYIDPNFIIPPEVKANSNNIPQQANFHQRDYGEEDLFQKFSANNLES